MSNKGPGYYSGHTPGRTPFFSTGVQNRERRSKLSSLRMSSPPPNLGGKGVNPQKPVSMHSSPKSTDKMMVLGWGKRFGRNAVVVDVC